MSLQQLFKEYLLMNRKERFFTGTVFPMLVARDNFAHFGLFLDLLGVESLPQVAVGSDSANIQFFTEYGFLESCIGKDAARFENHLPEFRDTPDILILITGDDTHLIALEAKMYDNPTSEALDKQMENQAVRTLNLMASALEIPSTNVHQRALLPQQLLDRIKPLKCGAITWNDLLARYEDVLGSDDYWIVMLRIALEKYSDLVAKPSLYGQNMKDRITGREIFNGYKDGSLTFKCMGRNQGLEGDPLKNDMDSGAWQRQLYEVNYEPDPPNANWFRIEDFVQRLELAIQPKSPGVGPIA